MTEVKRGLRVESVFKGSPAERPGSRPATRSSRSTAARSPASSSDAATALIKGPEGTEVTVGVRDGQGRQGRGSCASPRADLGAGRQQQLEDRGGREARLRPSRDLQRRRPRRCCARRCDKLQKQGAEGLVLDLRGNGGGLLEEAVLTASIFLPEGETVVTTDSRTQGHAVYKTKGGNLPALPIVVLIDRNTASAAEILTAALADDAGAKVVGTRSYGKGVFQQEVDLSNGGALKLTVGEYFTPDGTNLAGKGIHPDVGRDDPATAPDEALERALGGAGRPKDERARLAPAPRTLPARRAAAAGAAERRRPPATRSRRCCARSWAGAASAPALEAGGRRAASVAEARSGPRRDLTGLPTFTVDPATARDFDDAVSAQREGDGDPALDPHRRRRRPRPARLAARPRGEAARQQHLRARRGRADAAACAQRGGLQPRAGGRAPRGDGRDRAGRRRGRRARELLSQPHPLRRAARLRPARHRLLRPRRSAAERSPSRSRWPARPPRRSASGAARPASTSSPSSPSSASTRAATWSAPAASPQTESHRLIERLMILANEQVGAAARAQAGADDLPRPRAARPAAGRTADRAAARARDPDAAAARDARAEPGGGAGGRGEPAGARRRRRGAGTAARRIHRSCCDPSNRPPTASATAATPGSAAPPTAISPRRSAATRTWSSTARCWRRWGRASRRRSAAEAREVACALQRARARVDADRARRRRHLRRLPARARAARARRGDGRSRARSRGRSAPAPSSRFGGELGDVYEGFLPARRIGGAERFELDETETALVGRRVGPQAAARRPDIRPGDRGRSAPAAGSTWSRPGTERWPRRARRNASPASGDVATNRRAGHKFELVEKMEAGIVLRGSEVKSLRNGKAQMTDAYAVVDEGRGLAAQPPHPALRAGQPREPRARAAAQAAPAPGRDRAPGRQDGGAGTDPDPDPDLLQRAAGEGRAGAGAGQGGARSAARDRGARRAPRGRARIQGPDEVASGL